MNIPIKTNQLEIDMDQNALDKKFDVFKVETTQEYFKYGALILDTPLLCNQVRSVYFDSGRCFYVLMEKNTANIFLLKDILLKTDDGDNITIGAMDIQAADKRVLVSLLLNGLGSYDCRLLRFNNLTGHLYCFHPKWIKKSSRENESKILKIPCLKFAVTRDMRLTITVHTFTSELLKKQMIFDQRKFEQYPKYTLSAKNTLRRKLNTDTDACFILRQTQNDRTEIPFMDIRNLEKFESSKMGMAANILARFNDRYKGICRLEFQSINEYTAADSPKSLVKENRRTIQKLLTENKIKIVDCVSSDDSFTFCNEIKEILKEKYGMKATVGKRTAGDCLNLCVIHNRAYYNGSHDPHDKVYDGTAVQHITLENFKDNADAAITTVIHELLIKRDIVHKRISLFDWSSTGINTEISFGMQAAILGEKRYFFMKIKPDGSFDFEEHKFDLFTLNDYTDCVNIFTDTNDVAGIIRYENGDINIIRKTSWFTIPEMEEIHKKLTLGDTCLRGKEKRRALLSSITDIKLFEQGRRKYYFAGIIGEGMRAVVNSSANIRMIEPYKNAPVKFDDLLPLMNVTFVRNGQLTVLPFPFKYLREYILSIQQKNE